MNQQTTAQTEPDAKRADQLVAGDHVIETPSYERDEQPMRVSAVQPFHDGNRRPMVSLLLDALDGTEPMYATVKPEKLYDLATDAQLADMQVAGRRTAVVKALHQLATDIAVHKLPIPRHTLHIGGVVPSRADLEAWAKHLDAEIEMGGTGRDIPAIRKDVKVEGGPALYIGWQSPVEPKPAPEPEHVVAFAKYDADGEFTVTPVAEPEQEWLFTFAAGQTFAGRFVRIVGTYESARSRMNRVFGHAWCAQHTWRSFDEEALQAHLTELPESEWPAHAEAAPLQVDNAIAAAEALMEKPIGMEASCGCVIVWSPIDDTTRVAHDTYCPAATDAQAGE